ncbi:hypothetical protein LWI28_018936 [Acer negundo]|uniref:TF-B3 domain-containing protein n=1 Tax=Acer negundo TaxID=4023 RepID=A0AAD5J0A3_ACENE|nr:hypothetical protein LWI28_018936 [Acer negundo]
MQGIPKVYLKKFGNELSTVATITVPNGRVWKVELTKDGTNIWFHGGWHEFVEYHSISTGYFLLFRYEKNSNFHVFIFDMSACEIRYPHNCVGLKNDSLTQKPPAFDSALEIKRKSTASLESPIFRRSSYESRSKRCKMEEAVGMKKSDSIGDESEHESKRTKFDAHELLDILKEMGIFVKMNFKYIAAKEKERAIAAARLFKPKNPSFMVIIQPRDACRCTMYVPFEFGKKYLISRDAKLVKLQDHDGREWSVKFWNKRSKVGGGDFTHGWSAFAKDNNLKDGDICLFELISEKNIVLKVTRIPKKFAKKFEKELSNIVTLMVPNSRIWHVGLRKDEGKLWFYDGWHDFVEYHSISGGYFLVFKYEKNSNFHVLIFDITCCEIQYPYFCLSPENDESVPHNEMENEDSVEIIDSTTPNPPEFSSFENNSFEKCPKSSGKIYTPTPLQQIIQAIDISESSSRPCSGSIPEVKHGYETPSKRLKVEEPVEINKLDATGDESELKNAAYKS